MTTIVPEFGANQESLLLTSIPGNLVIGLGFSKRKYVEEDIFRNGEAAAVSGVGRIL